MSSFNNIIVQNAKKYTVAPLGLLSFSFTTFILMFVETDLLNSDFLGQVASVAIFYGGLAQFIAGILEIIYKNLVNGVIFCSYGVFWLSYAFFYYMNITDTYDSLSKDSHAVYLICWGFLTTLFTILSYKKCVAIKAVFITLQLTFYLLGAGVYNDTVKKIGGYIGFLTAIFAGYAGFAELFEEVYKYKLIGM